MVLLEGFRSWRVLGFNVARGGRRFEIAQWGVDLAQRSPLVDFGWRSLHVETCQRDDSKPACQRTTTTCTNFLIAPQKYRALHLTRRQKGPLSALVLAQKYCPVSSVSRHILVYFHAALLGPLHRFDSNRSQPPQPPVRLSPTLSFRFDVEGSCVLREGTTHEVARAKEAQARVPRQITSCGPRHKLQR